MARLSGVHAFGYNSAGSEPIYVKFGAVGTHCLPLARQILGAIRAEARARERADFCFFCPVNNARLYRFLVGHISHICTQDVDLRDGESFWNEIFKIFPQWVVFSKNARF